MSTSCEIERPEPECREFAEIRDLVEDARAGRMVILVGQERGQEVGRLVIPADAASPEAINFMATHGRGLVCLGLTRARTEQLGLKPMARRNTGRPHTAFMQSIEARQHVSTGISAFDRAETIRVAADPSCGADAIATPGHVFPVQAFDGGVLIHAGPAEAAIDLTCRAGRSHSAVFCEILDQDGNLAGHEDLVAFAQTHGIRLGRVSDLVADHLKAGGGFRRLTTRQVDLRASGSWCVSTYRDDVTGDRHTLLTMGDITRQASVLTAVCKSDVASLFGFAGDEDNDLGLAMRQISACGSGVILLTNDHVEGAGIGTEPTPAQVAEFERKTHLLATMGATRLKLINTGAGVRFANGSVIGVELAEN